VAAFIPCANAAQVQMQYAQSNGDFAENVFWVTDSAGWTGAKLNDLCETFIDWFPVGGGGQSLQGFVSTGTSLVNVAARDYTTQNGVVGASQESLPLAGLDAGADVAKGITWAITGRTGLAGRSFRSRMYVIGLTANSVPVAGTNVVDSTHAAHMILAMNGLGPAIQAAVATQTLVVCSRRVNNAPRANGVMTPITSYGYHNLFTDFQRRRAPAHNRHH
jgi:hypothetical protein